VEYLAYREVMAKREAVQAAFEHLMATRTVVGRPGARQWRFFRACAERLFGIEGEHVREFAAISRTTAAQYKFEVERKLRLFYQGPGQRHDHVFVLVHGSQLRWLGLSATGYPCCAGYALLVREMADNGLRLAIGRELVEYLERVVAEGMAAELQAYFALPEIRLDGLARWFVPEGPAMLRIADVVQAVARRGWSLQSPMNPSTCQLLSVNVKEVRGNDAEVVTSEYWYLRWWDRRKKKYVYVYQETNRQRYILKKIDSDWRIFQNIRPQPRTSQPRRWKRM